ncbi:MAG: hypothetical protein J4G05_04535, partial [Chlorobi bacterium]|nr:hypothetical protein [Chlorobiota bacterium]
WLWVAPRFTSGSQDYPQCNQAIDGLTLNNGKRRSYEGHHRLKTFVEEIQRLMVADGIEPGRET